MSKQYYNWQPVVKSLLETLKSFGFELYAVDDGCDDACEDVEILVNDSVDEAVKLITGVDEASLYVKYPEFPRKLWIWIVLGNEPFETVADYSHIPHFNLLDKAITKFSDEWEDKTCPMVDEEEYHKLIGYTPKQYDSKN